MTPGFRRAPLTCEIMLSYVSTWLLVAFFVLSPEPASAQASFSTRASGSWNSSQTWTIVSGTDSDTIPDTNDNVTILSGHTITAGNANRNCANLTVNSGGTLSIDNSGNVRINADPGSATINGVIAISSSGTLAAAGTGTRSLLIGSGGTLVLSGSAAFPTFTTYNFDPQSTVAYTASANQNVQSGIAYGNLTVGGSGKKTVSPVPSDTIFTTNGTVTIAGGTTLDVSTNILYVHFNGDVVINGTLDASVGTVVLEMRGAHWTDNGVYLRSVTAGFGLQPTITFHNTQIGGTTAVQKFYDVCIQGDASALASIDSAHNIEIRPGAILHAGASQVYSATGNWINNGTYLCGGATVAFIGTSTETVAGSTFAHLVVNNPAGLTLAGDVTIPTGGTLVLTNGNVMTGAYTIRIDNPTPTAFVPGSNKIVGRVTRAIASGSSATYSFLSANASITPNGIGNPSSISMIEFPNTNPPNLSPSADTNKVVKRYYTTTGTGEGSGFAYTMRLPYLQSEVRGNEGLYVLFSNNGSGWINMGSVIADTTNNYVEQSGLTGFSNWAIAEGDVTLPIQLTHFSASALPHAQAVQLVWGTVSEMNNYGFAVQRKTSPANEYVDLPNGFVPGHGTTLEPHEYQWTDYDVQPETYYYRLKQIDLDGTLHFTEGVRVEVSSVTAIDGGIPVVFHIGQNYPNPFNPSTTIGFTVDRRDFATLVVYNLTGQRIATLFSDVAVPGQRYSVRFDGDKLSNGTYFAKLVSGGRSALQKLVLLK